MAADKVVILEGLEGVFIVIAAGTGRDLLWPARVSALAACVLVLAVGAIMHKSLSRVPEKSLKFGVGVMLSAFGVYSTGEGLGVARRGHDLAILGFALTFLVLGVAPSSGLRRPTVAGSV